MGDAGGSGLVTFARDRLLEKIAFAEGRIGLASPFLTAAIAAKIGVASERSTAGEKRLLTALSARSVRAGVLDATALELLQGAGFEVKSIPNLHAKVALVDSWALVGSGNLTGAGLGGGTTGNVELGVILDAEQTAEASGLFEAWWERATTVSAETIAAFSDLPPYPASTDDASVGEPLALGRVHGLAGILGEDTATAGGRRYWIKSNYHRQDDAAWWHRGWISDRRQAPYAVGDLIVLYLAARDGGPASCPAIVRVVERSHHNRQWVLDHRDPDAADRWPYVTKTELVAEVPIEAGVPLSVVDKNGQSVQGGYCSIDRLQFERFAEAMLVS